MWATYFMVCKKCSFFSLFFWQESNNSNILWNNFDRLNLSGNEKKTRVKSQKGEVNRYEAFICLFRENVRASNIRPDSYFMHKIENHVTK